MNGYGTITIYYFEITGFYVVLKWKTMIKNTHQNVYNVYEWYNRKLFLFLIKDAVMLHSFTLRQQLQAARQGTYDIMECKSTYLSYVFVYVYIYILKYTFFLVICT